MLRDKVFAVGGKVISSHLGGLVELDQKAPERLRNDRLSPARIYSHCSAEPLQAMGTCWIVRATASDRQILIQSSRHWSKSPVRSITSRRARLSASAANNVPSS